MIPIPSLYIKVGAAAAALTIAFAAGWKVESWRTSAQVERLMTKHAELQLVAANKAKDAETARAAAEAKNRADEAAFNQKLQEAQDGARKRETTLRADAAASRAAAGSLRDQLTSIRGGLAEASSQARADTAAALTVVLERCSVEYRELAEVADRHASDVRTLIDAWPVQPTR